ncbi:hypothetical protein R5R35_001213 [Gryllus longicercus]|uniref:Uncharacterized protein n=1 Tax=Gryllus longicercus TaxID=2509291 RepID=A0AAN9VQL9_9ORTH
MASPGSSHESDAREGSIGDAFQLLAQGLEIVQNLEAERRMQETLRLQEERASRALGEMDRKMQEKDDAIRALQQRLEETQQRVTAVEERRTASEGSGGEGLQRLDGRVNEVDVSLQRAVQKFLPLVETLLCQLEKPQSTRASLATAVSTSAASAREAPMTGGAAAGSGKKLPSYSTPTPSGAGHQGAAAEEEGARQLVELRVHEVQVKIEEARTSPFPLGEQLCDAARGGRLRDVQRLIDSGADVNYTDGDGSTPLHKAAFNAHAEVVSLLLQRGADPNAVNCSGDSALHFAAWNDGSGRCVVLLVRAGADVNARDKDGETPLHRAAWMEHSGRCVELLVRAGADVNARDEDEETPLHKAACSDVSSRCVELLVRAGADVNARDEDEETPLHKAACSDNSGLCVLLLVRAGADVNARDTDGMTPLHRAAYQNNKETARVLLAGGARRDLKGWDGFWKNKTAFDLATTRGLQDLLRL